MKSAPYMLTAALLTASALPAGAANEVADFAAGAQPPAVASHVGGYLDQARELVMRSLALIGIRYRFGGSTPDDGFDCSGLVSHVFREVAGLVLPRDSRAMSKVGYNVDKTLLQPGDLVFFNTRRQPYSHVGIYIGDHRFVHAPSRGREVEVAHMHDRYWRSRFNGARRVSF